MFRFTNIIKTILLLVIVYSTYIYFKIPSLTEEFTSNIREAVRPTIRKYRLSVEEKMKNINNVKENFKMKLGV